MGAVTFVFNYEDGKEPRVSPADTYLGGKLVSISFYNLSERYQNLEAELDDYKSSYPNHVTEQEDDDE